MENKGQAEGQTDAVDPDASEAGEWHFWQPFVAASALCCIVVFAIAAVGPGRGGPNGLGGLFAAAAILSQSQLAGILAALGNGSYLKRLAITQVFVAAVFLSLVGGVFVWSVAQPQPDFFTNVLLTGLLASVAPQFVYGCFRFLRGWRIHTETTPRGKAFNLQDLFAFTMLAAVALSIINATLMNSNAFEPDGIYAVVFITAFFALTSLVFGVPTLKTVFSIKSLDQGCVAQLILVAVIGFVVVIPFLSLGADDLIVPLLLLLVGFATGTWLPLAIMRERGVVLTNWKDED